MDESRLRTIEQLKEFLNATPLVAFSVSGIPADVDCQRYEHICRVLKRSTIRSATSATVA